MNKNELISSIASVTGLTKTKAAIAVDAFVSSISSGDILSYNSYSVISTIFSCTFLSGVSVYAFLSINYFFNSSYIFSTL